MSLVFAGVCSHGPGITARTERADPAQYKKFVAEAQAAAERRYAVYQQLAGITVPVVDGRSDEPAPGPGGAKEE